MIWVIGGTSDAREFLAKLTQYTKHIIATTATSYGKFLLEDMEIEIREGKLSKEEMLQFIKENGIDRIADLSHPYAAEVSKNAMEASKEKGIRYFRYERKELDTSDRGIQFFQNVEDIAEYIENLEGNILVTLGSNSIEKFKGLKNLENIYFRILPKWEMIKKCEEAGISPGKIIAMQGPFNLGMNCAIISQYNIKYLVTKKGGDAGGEKEKLQACVQTGAVPIVLSRPKIMYENSYEDIGEMIKGVMA